MIEGYYKMHGNLWSNISRSAYSLIHNNINVALFMFCRPKTLAELKSFQHPKKDPNLAPKCRKNADENWSGNFACDFISFIRMTLRLGRPTKSLYQEKSSATEIKGATNPQMCHSDGLRILDLDFTIFCCGIIYSIILIVLCSVNDLKSGKVYRGYSFTC